MRAITLNILIAYRYNLNQLQTNSYKLIPDRENYSSFYFMYIRLLQ